MIYNKACQETKNQTNKKNPKTQKREIIKETHKPSLVIMNIVKLVVNQLSLNVRRESLFLVRRISEKILTCKEEDIYICIYVYVYTAR